MNLGFRTHYPFEKLRETKFEQKILDGIKIHTIREDKFDRWVPGRLAHFCTGIRTKFYRCFKKDTIVSTQQVRIVITKHSWGTVMSIYIEGKELPAVMHDQFVRNDGFDSVWDFYAWFCPGKQSEMNGKILHWTNFKYKL